MFLVQLRKWIPFQIGELIGDVRFEAHFKVAQAFQDKTPEAAVIFGKLLNIFKSYVLGKLVAGHFERQTVATETVVVHPCQISLSGHHISHMEPTIDQLLSLVCKRKGRFLVGSFHSLIEKTRQGCAISDKRTGSVAGRQHQGADLP